MTTVVASVPGPRVGDLLRDWRQRRRLSQLELAVDAEVSARHLSFVETGRSKPSRELVIHLAEHLDVPLRERNTLLLAAGYAPTYRERHLDDDAMASVRHALDKLVQGHEPFPAIVIDRTWNLVTANRAALALLTEGVDPKLLAPPANALRVSLHPDGLAPRIANFAEWAGHLLSRLDREIAASADPTLTALREEVLDWPSVERSDVAAPDLATRLFVPLRLRSGDDELSFFSTVATFGTALDITIAELSIESFFPADERTEEALRTRASSRERGDAD